MKIKIVQFIWKHVDNQIRAVFLIVSMFPNEISPTLGLEASAASVKTKGDVNLQGSKPASFIFIMCIILRALLSWLHHTRCLCSCHQKVAALFWSVQPDWEDLPRSPGLHQPARAVSVRHQQGSLERQPSGE